MTPPPEMVMSRDLDMYPQLDPGRGFIEISSQIGEGSSFHVEHGFYADPITPKLLALPEGWESRIAPISMSGGIVAMFLDPNDVAIGKLMRGNDNDLCWVRAGLAESLLNAATILQRERTATNASMDEHQRLRAALIAMTNPESASAPDVPKG